MFRIKICGITDPREAEAAVEAGADAVGINFFRGSPRYVAPGAAGPIARLVAGRALVVGVFVNEAPGVVAAVCREAGIDAVQLAGDEPAEDAAMISLPRLKSIRPGENMDFAGAADYPCEAFLVDAGARGEFGGTGRTLDWGGLGARLSGAAGERAGGPLRGRPWILAGGLGPDNVADAIRLARPSGVDVASGVEFAPGRKDTEKVRAFIMNARKGFADAAA